MPFPLIAAGLSALAGIATASIQAGAASSAAADQTAAAQSAINAQMQMFNVSQGELQPYISTGQNAESLLSYLLGVQPTANTTPAAPQQGMTPIPLGSSQQQLLNAANTAQAEAQGGYTQYGNNTVAPISLPNGWSVSAAYTPGAMGVNTQAAAQSPNAGESVYHPSTTTYSLTNPQGTPVGTTTNPNDLWNLVQGAAGGPLAFGTPSSGGQQNAAQTAQTTPTVAGSAGADQTAAAGGATGSLGFGSLIAPFQPTMAQLAQTPGYQFALQQGLLNTQNGFAAKGLGSSGNAIVGGANYAEGLASTTYQQQFQNYLAQNAQIANLLMGPTQVGAQSGAALGGLATQTGQGVAASNIGIGNAQGAAATASGAAYAQGLSQGPNVLQSYANMNYLNQLQQQSPMNQMLMQMMGQYGGGTVAPLTSGPNSAGNFFGGVG